jgi:hypothetical protein
MKLLALLACAEVLPRNQLSLGLFLKADRMRGLVITRENLENQRQAVKEEEVRAGGGESGRIAVTVAVDCSLRVRST